MSKTIVLGIGNLLMQDDGIGVRIAGELKDRLAAENVEVVTGETDVAYCLDYICADDFVVLLDAMRSGGAPGSVCMLPLDKAASCRANPFAMHELNVVDAIAADSAINGVLIGIEPKDVGFGLDLSGNLQNQFSRICADVERLLQKILEENKMRDLFMAEKISNTVVALCWKQNIGLITELVVGVHPNSHLDEEQLAALIKDKKPMLVDDGTRIRFVRDMAEQNAAEIRSIGGKPERKL